MSRTPAANQAPHILISAHHCAPGMGSEHAVGWNLVSELAKRHNIILITEDNEFRPAVEAGVAELNASGGQVIANFVQHGCKTDGRKNNLRLGYYLSYVRYQWRVYQLALTLQLKYRIEAVHHLNIVGFREPGFLWRLNLPFIWGPVGGLVYTPLCLINELPLKSKVFQAIRAAITWLQFGFSARVRSAYRATQRNGGAFIAATPDIGRRFTRRFGGDYHWIPETGSSQPAPVREDQATSQSVNRPLKLLWTGALIDRKPMGMLLDAIALIPDHSNRIQLTVVGDGDSRATFEDHARRRKVTAQFLGWRTHDEALTYFKGADLFTLLSVSDLTTNVVFEALSNGLPVLCLDHHGYANIVTEDCGFKLPISSPGLLRHQLSQVLQDLIQNPAQLNAKKACAMRRASEFTWARNAEKISTLYPNVMPATAVMNVSK